MRTAILAALLTMTGGVARAVDDPLLPPGNLLGQGCCLITDLGHAVVGLDFPDVRGRMSLMVWKGEEPGMQALDVGGKSLTLLPEGRIGLYGYKLVEGVDPYEDSYTYGDAFFVHQVYRIKGSRLHLERELRLAPDDVEAGMTRITSDFKTWVRMENLRRETQRGSRVHGRRFAIETTRSGKTRRSEALELYPANLRDDDTSAFEILDPEGPVLLASYAADLFVVWFGDYGASSRPVDHLRHVVHPYGGDLDVVWQPEDDVLWARKGSEWLAYDLWNVRYEYAVPEVPFLRRSASGFPHPIRGFVEIERDGSRYRVRHSWRSPQFADWREEHVSAWRGGPLPAAVSPNGRHALVLESGSTEEGGKVVHARRFGLDLAPALPPRRW